MDNTYTSHDYAMSEKSFREWQRKQDEALDESALRRRRTELYALVNKVINRELSDEDRQLVIFHWYEDKSVSEIAALLHLDKTTVYRRLNRITDTIYDKLKYAVEYHFDEATSQSIRPIIKNDGPFFYTAPADSAGKRLKNLRRRYGLSIEQVSKMSSIPVTRLWNIEQENVKPVSEDIATLSRLYSESCDFIIFGERRDMQ